MVACAVAARISPAAPPSHPSHSVLDGQRFRTLPRDLAVHPFKPKVLCLNYLRYRVGAYPGVRIDIPLKSFNQERCPAFKEGGWLMELSQKVRVRVCAQRRGRVEVGRGARSHTNTHTHTLPPTHPHAHRSCPCLPRVRSSQTC